MRKLTCFEYKLFNHVTTHNLSKFVSVNSVFYTAFSITITEYIKRFEKLGVIADFVATGSEVGVYFRTDEGDWILETSIATSDISGNTLRELFEKASFNHESRIRAEITTIDNKIAELAEKRSKLQAVICGS